MRPAVLVLLCFAAGPACHEADPEELLSPQPKPCANVYAPAVNACVAASGCIGIACLSAWDRCSADVQRGPLLECCVANYPTYEARMECIDSLGAGP